MKGYRTIVIFVAVILLALAALFGFELPFALVGIALEFAGIDDVSPEQLAAASSAIVSAVAIFMRTITTTKLGEPS